MFEQTQSCLSEHDVNISNTDTLNNVHFSGDELGTTEWGHIARAVKCHPKLQDLADFEWSRSVLAPGVTDIDLRNKSLGDVSAVVLGHMLQRSCSTLSTLRLR